MGAFAVSEASMDNKSDKLAWVVWSTHRSVLGAITSWPVYVPIARPSIRVKVDVRMSSNQEPSLPLPSFRVCCSQPASSPSKAFSSALPSIEPSYSVDEPLDEDMVRIKWSIKLVLQQNERYCQNPNKSEPGTNLTIDLLMSSPLLINQHGTSHPNSVASSDTCLRNMQSSDFPALLAPPDSVRIYDSIMHGEASLWRGLEYQTLNWSNDSNWASPRIGDILS